MRPLPILKAALIVSSGCLLFGCQKEVTPNPESTVQGSFTNKENKEYKLNGKSDFYYTFLPDLAAGWVPPQTGPGWVLGGSVGEMNYIGRCESYFAHYNYVVTQNPFTVKARGVSLNLFYRDSLKAKLGEDFTVPNEASMVNFDKQGNSISSKVDENGMTYQKVNDTLFTFSSRYIILTGTGKFAGVKGWFIVDGYFDPRLPLLGNKLGYQFNAGTTIKEGVMKF